MGFMYENDGPETFAYFFVTLSRLVPLYHECRDPRVVEALRRHCAWMSRWMLPEPDGETVILAGSHQTRTGGGYRLTTRSQNGVGELLGPVAGEGGDGFENLSQNGEDERRFLKLFLDSDGDEVEKRRAWGEEIDPVGHCRRRSAMQGYTPVSTLALYPPYAPAEAEVAEVRRALPCLNRTAFAETQVDGRGNQYVFVRHPAYYVGLAFSECSTTAQHGPGFLWLADGGTVILSENGNRPCWETRVGSEGTGKAPGLATVREGRGGHEVILRYGELGLAKTYVIRPEGMDVLVSGRVERTLSERVPLLLREDDVICLDYGRCPACGMGSRVLGVVTQRLGIERKGRRLLTFDFGAPVSASLKPTYDPDGYIRTELTFPLPAVWFLRQTGYRVRVAES